MIWLALVFGLALYYLVTRFFYEDDTLLDLDSSHFNALFAVANRLEKLYRGSKVYVGVQIPDSDSASRQNIDLVLATNQEAAVISVKNVSGFISIDKDGSWVCTDVSHGKTECVTDPVAETKRLVPILEEYLEKRGVTLPEGFLSCKVICPNPGFRAIDPDSFPPDVMTYDQWAKLKPQQKHSSYSGWIKGMLQDGKDKLPESFYEQLKSILSTAPASDRLELSGKRYVLGEFLEFKGKQEDLRSLRKIKRSKVSKLSVEKISMFGLANSTLRVLYTPRDYRVESSSELEAATVRSNTEVLFQPQSSSKVRKYKLSSVVTLWLSA